MLRLWTLRIVRSSNNCIKCAHDMSTNFLVSLQNIFVSSTVYICLTWPRDHLNSNFIIATPFERGCTKWWWASIRPCEHSLCRKFRNQISQSQLRLYIYIYDCNRSRLRVSESLLSRSFILCFAACHLDSRVSKYSSKYSKVTHHKMRAIPRIQSYIITFSSHCASFRFYP